MILEKKSSQLFVCRPTFLKLSGNLHFSNQQTFWGTVGWKLKRVLKLNFTMNGNNSEVLARVYCVYSYKWLAGKECEESNMSWKNKEGCILYLNTN